MATKRETERLTKAREPIPGTWRGIDWWFCPLCPKDADSEADVLAHIAAAHPIEEPTELQRMTASAEPESPTETTEE